MKSKWTKKIAAVALGASVLVSSFGMGSASAASYTVQKGDTLYKIATKHKTTYKNIMQLSSLKSTNIYPGQKLTVSGKATVAQPAKPTVQTNNKLVTNARKQLGVRYTFGGTNPRSGFDCSGFITYVLNQSGKSTARKTAAGFYNSAKKVAKPQVGDLVFYSGTYKRGVSHVGIYIGNNQMISAAGNSVRIDNVYSSYWKNYFTGFGRV